MGKKGKGKEPPPPPTPESEVELLPGKDGAAEPVVLDGVGTTRMGRWSVALAKQGFVVVVHDAGTTVMLPSSYAGVVFARERSLSFSLSVSVSLSLSLSLSLSVGRSRARSLSLSLIPLGACSA